MALFKALTIRTRMVNSMVANMSRTLVRLTELKLLATYSRQKLVTDSVMVMNISTLTCWCRNMKVSNGITMTHTVARNFVWLVDPLHRTLHRRRASVANSMTL